MRLILDLIDADFFKIPQESVQCESHLRRKDTSIRRLRYRL